MKSVCLTVDIVVFGGGIAGLWLLNRLRTEGYNAILLESNTLGHGQTIASQGMIHGGIKYALGGALTGSSEAIASMPGRWRDCLKGEGEIDLRAARVLSEHFYMWSNNSLGAKFTSFFASKVMRGRVDRVDTKAYPAPFNDAAFNGNLYQLVDLVLDVPSLLAALLEHCREAVFKIDWHTAQFEHNSDGSVKSVSVQSGDKQLEVAAQQWALTAGEGNGAIMKQLAIKQPVMQLRPLHQVLVKHNHDIALYAHCVGNNPAPRLTVSSHRCKDGKMLWYLGGDLATQGAEKSAEELISFAQQELSQLLPWLDLSDAQWSTLYINRAEPKQSALVKPDKAFAQRAKNCSNVIVGWPTKLTLAPDLSDQVLTLLQAGEFVPQSATEDLSTLESLDRPAISSTLWENL